MLLIGYGNPLRTDDGIGQVVVDSIPEILGFRDSVETITCHQLLPEHAEAISHADRVIFVDAGAGPDPGQITVREISPVAEGSAGLIHDFTPQTLLVYAQLLYGKAPAAVLVTVTGYSFEHGENLTPQMAALLPDIMARVRELLR